MEHKSKKEFSHFVLSPEDKVALIEAKMQRVEAQVKTLAELATAKNSARGSKYPTL
jgi:hypothetical protein